MSSEELLRCGNVYCARPTRWGRHSKALSLESFDVKFDRFTDQRFHFLAGIAGEANQIFRPATMFDHGIDGEVEFKDNDGNASGKRIYIQLKSGNSYLRTRKGDGREIFDVSNERHLDYWVSQPVDVYLVIRQTDEASGAPVIRWMNVTRYLKARKDQRSRQIIFDGHKLDMEAVWKVRDQFFGLK